VKSTWHEQTERQILNELIYTDNYSHESNLARIDYETRQELNNERLFKYETTQT